MHVMKQLWFSWMVIYASLTPLCGKADFVLTAASNKESRYVLGEPIVISICVSNTARRVRHLNTNIGDGNEKPGLMFYLSRQDNALDIPMQLEPFFEPEQFVQPYEVVTNDIDLATSFSISTAGRYSLYVRYVDLLIACDPGDDDTRTVNKLMDVRSDTITFTVDPPDPAFIAEIERLLRSTKDQDVEEGLLLASSARNGVYQRIVPLLWELLQNGRTSIRNNVLKVFLKRLNEGLGIVPAVAFFDVLDRASFDNNDEVRIAVARALCNIRWRNNNREQRAAYNNFMSFSKQRLSKWFDRESSSVCREMLVASASGSGALFHRYDEIIQTDPSAQVRAAVVIELINGSREHLLAVGSTYTNLEGIVKVDGKMIPFSVFLKEEIDSIRAGKCKLRYRQGR